MGFKDFTRRMRDTRNAWPTAPGPARSALFRGRNGLDELGRATFVAACVCIVLGFLPKLTFFAYIAFVLLGILYWRILSKNTGRRYQENLRYLTLARRVRRFWPNLRSTLADRRVNHYYKCPSCKKRMRVPRGKGKVKVTCPGCRTEFVKKA
ncbi:MAG: hypothetical protein AB2L09_09180 [Coriobacteriia bacterium]